MADEHSATPGVKESPKPLQQETAGKKTPEMANSEPHTPDPAHVAPPDRRLGSLSDAINPPAPHIGAMDSVDFQLRKLVGLTIQSSQHKAGFTAEFLDEVTDLTSQYMHSLIDSLHRLTEVQRHQVPGIADLEMCFHTQHVSPTQLYQEYQRTRRLDEPTKAMAQNIKGQLDHILREYNAEHYNLDKNDPSLVFHANEQYEIAALVPRQNRPRDYIPEYFPDLPPDFTYTSTGDYMQTISELKEIKVKLADESRLNEMSLYKLIDDDDARWNSAFEQALEASSESENDEIMSISGDRDTTDGETPAQEPEKDVAPAPELKNRFDFVAYAKKRRLAKERYAAEIQRRRDLRERNIFMKAETFYSASASKVASKNDKEFFQQALEKRFKKVIKATRKAETNKVAELKALLERKRREEKQKEQSNGMYEFGFNFDSKPNLSDSDDEMQDVAENKPIVFEEERDEPSLQFEFGDEADLASEASDLAELEAELEAGVSLHEGDKGESGESEHGPSRSADTANPAAAHGADMWGSDIDSDELQDLE